MLLNSKATQTSLLYLTALGLGVASCYFSFKSPEITVEVSLQDHSMTPRTSIVRHFSLGLKRSIADIIWIHTLMESDTEHYKAKDLRSWMYLRFAAIAELDPRFYENYHYGSQYLMIIKDDLPASEALLREGLRHYPDDVSLNWQLGYLYAIEKNTPLEAMPYLDRIRFNPRRPQMFDSLYTRIASGTLGKKEAFDYALEVWKSHAEGTPIKERLAVMLYTLKASLDLECLNQNRKDCPRDDFDGNPYVYEKGTWRAQKSLISLERKALPGRER
jgi:hypothetical protein